MDEEAAAMRDMAAPMRDMDGFMDDMAASIVVLDASVEAMSASLADMDGCKRAQTPNQSAPGAPPRISTHPPAPQGSILIG